KQSVGVGAAMRVCVVGLWHLGAVTAACLASRGHDTVGLDFDESLVAELRRGRAPLFEPDLDALIQQGIDSGKLHFAHDIDEAVREADIVWVTYDTPVDEQDVADTEL